MRDRCNVNPYGALSATLKKMNDDALLHWLIQMTSHIAKLHAERKPNNAGPRYHADSFTIEDEDFSRWMGWRGPEPQGEETAWPADELRQERADRHRQAFKQLRRSEEHTSELQSQSNLVCR